MKAIFLNDRPDTVDRFFNEACRNRLRQHCRLPDQVVTGLQCANEPERTHDVDWILSTWGMPVLTPEQIRVSLPNLKAVFYAAGSVQYFARPFLAAGVRVFSAWKANAVPVAELAAAQILLANKGFFQAAQKGQSDRMAARQAAEGYPGNYATLVGLLGAGMIGTLVIEYLRQTRLQMKVFDPFLSAERAAQLGVERWSLDEIFARCQTISNHLANNEQTRHLITARHFDVMLPNATFINTGRGAQLVEADLIAALKAEPGRMAILDVTDPEPPEPDSELLTLPNVILTPHIAGAMNEETWRMAAYMADEVDRLATGQLPLYEVTLPMLATMA